MATKDASGRTALAKWQRRVREQMDGVEEALTRIPAERWNTAPPAGDDWTAAQHIEHLNVTTALVVDKIEAALAATPPPGNPDDWKPGWFSRIFIAACGPQPPGRATPAPKVFLPGDGPFEPVALGERFTSAHERFLAQMARCGDTDIARVIVPSAASPLLRVSLGTWFEAMAVHIAYHVGRAKNLLQ